MLLFTVIRPWTFIIVIHFQGGCVYQISTLELLISGLIPFLDFCPLIRAVEKLHPRYFFSGKLFWTSFGIFLTLSDHALISGQIQFQNFCPLIRAVEKFHPRHLYFSYSFYLNLKHFSCTSFIREARKSFWTNLGPYFSDHPIHLFEAKNLSTLLFARIPIIFHEEILEPPDFCNSIAYFRFERILMRYVKMFFISSFLCLSSWEKLGSPV